MKKLKELIAIVLFFTALLGMFPGCTAFNNAAYLTNGEFYSLFIESTNIYNDEYSQDNSDDYKAAEYLLYDRYYLDDDQLNTYTNLITKEIVAQVCVRYMEFRKTCDVKIKDINKCHDQQAVTDAVGMEILSLENGYFDAMQKMTAEECEEAIDKMLDIELNSHYEEGELEVEFNDDVVVIGDDIDIEDYTIIEEGDESVTPTSLAITDTAKAAPLDYKFNSDSTAVSSMANKTNEKIEFRISKLNYDRMYPKPVVNKVMIKPKYSDKFGQGDDNVLFNYGFDLYAPTAIMVTAIDESDPFNVRITGRLADAKEFLKDSDNEEKINKRNKSKNVEIKSVKDSAVPKGIKVKIEGGKLTATFGHTFKIEDEIYGTQKWRNPSFSPSINITAEIGDFSFDTKNIGKLILGKASEAKAKLTYHTRFNVTTLDGGLRYSPANNGNGGLKYSPEKGFSGNLFTNINNSRLTGASAGGSDKIKLAQVNIPLGESGFFINANIYLIIEFDGSISFEVNSEHKALLTVTKTRSGFSPSFVTSTKEQKTKSVRANLTVELQLTPNISFFGLNIIDAVGKIGGTIDAMASLYSTSQKKQSSKFYATQTELDDECKEDIKYCIGAQFDLYLGYEFLTTKSIIGKFVIDVLGLKNPSDKFTIWSCGFHYENDNGDVDKCTRENGSLEKNNDGEIRLDSYKLIFDGDEQQLSVAVESIPVAEKKLESVGGISVSSKNKKVATATFNEALNTVLVTAVGEGSTEIVVRIPKEGNGKSYFEQQVSVTVNKSPNAKKTSFVFQDDQKNAL